MPRLLSFTAFIATWWIASLLVGDAKLPPPPAVLAAMVTEARSGALFFNLGVTLVRVALAFTLAMSLGAAIGYLMGRVRLADRLGSIGNTLRYVRYFDDFPAFPLNNIWEDTTVAGYAAEKKYVVETSTKVVERCLLMTTDPGDLVLDPTCGSGTTGPSLNPVISARPGFFISFLPSWS